MTNLSNHSVIKALSLHELILYWTIASPKPQSSLQLCLSEGREYNVKVTGNSDKIGNRIRPDKS